MPKEVHNALSPKRVANEKTVGKFADGSGLYLVVSETGARQFIWRGVVQGKRREYGIGSARLIPLADARETARQWKRIAKAGGDPKVERDKAKRKHITFEIAARRVWQAQFATGGYSDKFAADWIASLERLVFPAIGSRMVQSIDQADVLKILGPIWIEKATTARLVRQRLRTILNWARTAGHFDGVNPVDGVEDGLPKQRQKVTHFLALPYQEVPALMLRLAEMNDMSALALRFAILTAARSGEVRGATWAEIDTDARLWTIPPERMKAGRQHRVPLCDAALAVLEQMRGVSDGLIFPSRRTGRPMSDAALSRQFKRLGVAAVPHGLRSSFRDWCEEMTGFPREVKEAALAHTVRDKVEAAYRRSDLFDKRRDLMDQWARFCVSAGGKGDVVELRR